MSFLSSFDLGKVILPGLLLFLAGIFLPPLFALLKVLLRPTPAPVKNLPGPGRGNLIWGQFQDILNNEHSVLHEQWMAQYGKVIKYPMFFGIQRICTTDKRAVAHLLGQSMIYEKPGIIRRELIRLFGPGLLNAEGEVHRRQRRIMNPAFSATHIRELTPIFIDKSLQLRDILLGKMAEKHEEKGASMDVLTWLTRTTLDVIGLAGFDYPFDALSEKPNELSAALDGMFKSSEFNPWTLVRAFIPALRCLPLFDERAISTEKSRVTMNRIGMQLIRERKAALMSAGNVEKKSIKGNDLLSLLIKSNMAEDVKPEFRFTDEEVLAQIATFIVAGHETTSTSVAWCLYALSLYPSTQDALRAELSAVQTDSPTMDQLNTLPYLDAVIRETMRIYATVPSIVRVANKDDIIPISEPYTGLDGVMYDHIKAAEGDTFFIPILSINRAEENFGPDSRDFKPERWLSTLPDAVADIPNTWGNTLSFSAGPHACIGYRFSVTEMKAILFTLVRGIRFELPDPAPVIERKAMVVTRPFVKGVPGSQLPLVLTAI